MKQRSPLFIFLVSILCLSAAFVLRKMIYQIVIVPLAYLWWLLTLYYHLIPQVIIWVILIFILFFMTVRGLLMQIPTRTVIPPKQKGMRGPLETLSSLVGKSNTGVYYKWLIANRLGKTARELLDQREARHMKHRFSRLEGRDWNPPEDVSAYLESGLNGSFADYPKRNWFRSDRTPLDINLQQVIEYLESEMENNRNGHQ